MCRSRGVVCLPWHTARVLRPLARRLEWRTLRTLFKSSGQPCANVRGQLLHPRRACRRRRGCWLSWQCRTLQGVARGDGGGRDGGVGHAEIELVENGLSVRDARGRAFVDARRADATSAPTACTATSRQIGARCNCTCIAHPVLDGIFESPGIVTNKSWATCWRHHLREISPLWRMSECRRGPGGGRRTQQGVVNGIKTAASPRARARHVWPRHLDVQRLPTRRAPPGRPCYTT